METEDEHSDICCASPLPSSRMQADERKLAQQAQTGMPAHAPGVNNPTLTEVKPLKLTCNFKNSPSIQMLTSFEWIPFPGSGDLAPLVKCLPMQA